jgi:hypothetical protein
MPGALINKISKGNAINETSKIESAASSNILFLIIMSLLKKRLDKLCPNYTLAKIRDLYYNRYIMPTDP